MVDSEVERIGLDSFFFTYPYKCISTAFVIVSAFQAPVTLANEYIQRIISYFIWNDIGVQRIKVCVWFNFSHRCFIGSAYMIFMLTFDCGLNIIFYDP